MIIFHEGLPRAGKTYEAMLFQALPALEAGRPVVTNIKGIDHAKIAEVTKLDVATVEDLLKSVPWEESANIHQYAINDGLVILDEVQDFFPPKCKLTPEQVEFITQHGQRGIDIVLCGQSYKNIHVFWRDRVQRLIYFKKLSALGSENRYQWTMNEKSGSDSFAKVQGGARKYDTKYYGIYKSHVDGVNNKGNLKDDRANLLKSKIFTLVIPAFFALGLVSVYFIYGFFKSPESIVHVQSKSTPTQQSHTVQTVATAAANQAGAIPNQEMKTVKGQGVNEYTAQSPADYVETMITKYRPRLAALLVRGDKTDGIIEIMDEGYKVREQFSVSGLKDFGYRYQVKQDFLILTRLDGKGGEHVVTPWPVDSWGRATMPEAKPVPPPVLVGREEPIAQAPAKLAGAEVR
ncbi:zonular occludens toxin domain-containing protein [Neisseriaceae bacterium TC5R-5]|nr:zonular occludens toxin domain-containing protein [Neisseriaceae bacterium TC5R-5]